MKTKKSIAIIMIILTLACGMPRPAHAAVVWGTLNIAGDFVKQMLEEISTKLYDAIASAAKMAAIKQATSSIENALYGGNSSPRNIENFTDFLITDSQDKAVTYAEDFLTDALRGTTSGDYTSASGGGSLQSAIESAGKSVLNGLEGKNTPTVDYANYCDGDSYFSKGNFECFSAIMSNSLNTPIGMALAIDQAAAAKYQQEKETATLIATSPGVLPQLDENNNVTNSSSVVEAIQLQQITLPLEALANGDNSVFSSLIESFAVSLITEIIEQGMGEAEQSLDKNLKAFENQYNSKIGDLSNSVGPASQYTNDKYDYVQKSQSGSSWKNPDNMQTEDRQSTPGGAGGV